MGVAEVKQRFYDHLDVNLLCSDNKATWTRMYKNSPDRKIEKVHFIHMPTHRRNYVALDIDVEGGAAIWWEQGFPEPTITIITPTTAHCKFLYELKNPVLYPASNGKSTIEISSRAIRFFEGVKRGLDQSMGGDKNYHGPAISNPLCNYFKVHWADKAYSLEELSEYCAVIPREYRKTIPDVTEGRHLYLFDTLRIWAYPQVKNVKSREELDRIVRNKAESIFYNEIQQMPGNHPYNLSEAMSAATSVVKFIWEHKDDPSFKQYTWNKGVMNFGSIEYKDLTDSEKITIHHERKSSGATYTADQKNCKTEEKIRDAIKFLFEHNQRPTKAGISRRSGISYRNVNNYKNFIDTVIKDYNR